MGREQPPTFDPRDEKYKKVEDLPEEEQENFVKVNGGFITQKAKRFEDAVLKQEELLNPKIFRGKTADIIQNSLKESPEEYIKHHRRLRRCKAWAAGEEAAVAEKNIMPNEETIPEDASTADGQSALTEEELSEKTCKRI